MLICGQNGLAMPSYWCGGAGNSRRCTQAKPGHEYDVLKWQVSNIGNGGDHINEVKLRRARLVLDLVTTFGGYTIPAT